MKMMKIFVIFLSLMATPGQSRDWMGLLTKRWTKKVARIMRADMDRMDQALMRQNDRENKTMVTKGKIPLYLQRFRLRIRPSVTFKIPLLVKLRIAPYLEFEWRKRPPRGWRDYSPVNQI